MFHYDTQFNFQFQKQLFDIDDSCCSIESVYHRGCFDEIVMEVLFVLRRENSIRAEARFSCNACVDHRYSALTE